MKKLFTLFTGIIIASSANATPFKALYAEATVEPAGAGYVYLQAKNAEDEGYVYDQSDDWDETAFIKLVIGENGSDENYPGCTGKIGLYEVKISVDPEADYELVCYADKVKEDGIYTQDDCFAVIHGASAADGRTFDFEYSGDGDWININNEDHPQDGHSTDGPSRDDVLLNFETYANENPDTKIYVIFRKIGDELPKLEIEDTAVRGISIDTKSNGVSYNLSGQQVGKDFKGVIIKDGKKIIVK